MTPYHRSKCLMDNSHLLLISVLSGPEIGSDTCRMKVVISKNLGLIRRLTLPSSGLFYRG